MRLPAPSFLKKTAEQAIYLGLLLRDEKITAVIFAEENKQIHAVATHEEYFDTSIEDAEMDELLDVFDKAVSIAETKLPKDTPQVQKTIFGVKENWIENEKIKKDYLTKLKKVCDELSLSPIGFLVFSEAIAHLLQKQEGTPVSAVYGEIGQQMILISLIKASKIVATKSAKIETFKIPQIVDSLLRHFSNFEVLPPKLIIQNDRAKTEAENEQLQQEFLSHSWSKTLPFLHMPQIVMLPLKFESQAILFGAATQMGLSVADEIAIPQVVSAETPFKSESAAALETENMQEANDEYPKSFEIQDGENFGFVQGTDIALSRIKEKSHEEETEQQNPHDIQDINPNTNILAAMEEQEIAKNEKMALPSQGIILFGNIRKFLTKIPYKIPGLLMALRGRRLIYLPPAILFLLIAVTVFYLFIVKTTVSIALRPDTKSADQQVTFTTDSNSDFSNNILAAQAVAVDENGSATVDASGKKNIGDKAKGIITLHNKDTGKQQMNAGVMIISSNGLKYTLDKDVTIASAAASDSGVTYGTAQANITAADIGTSYNLPSETKFTVNGTDTITAKNDNAFSGGTQKTVTAISQADIDKATNQLKSAIADKAKNDLSSKLLGDQALLSDFSESTIAKKSLNHKVNDQANNVIITGSVTYKAIAYKKSDLLTYGQQILKNKGSSTQILDKNSITADVHDIKTAKNANTSATLTIKGNFLPMLDNQKIASSIKGKSFIDAQNTIGVLPQIANTNLTLSPNIPLIPKRVSLKSRKHYDYYTQ